MRNKTLFLAMAEMYESYSTAGALPDDISKLGTRVQTSGKGDPSYMLSIVCGFHDLAGDNWDDFVELYAPTRKLSDKFIYSTSGKLSHFWDKLDNYRAEFERAARFFLNKHR